MKPKPFDLTPEHQEDLRRQLASGVDPRSIVVTRTKATRKGAKLGEMNSIEAEYARLLDARKASGEILDWKYEAIRLRIAFGNKPAWFKPDFWIVYADGSQHAHETKGWWRDAARVRIKVAAGVYSWIKFVGVRKLKKKDGGGWEFEDFS